MWKLFPRCSSQKASPRLQSVPTYQHNYRCIRRGIRVSVSRSVQELAWWWWEGQSPVTERRMMQPWGENSAAVYGVARGGVMCFICSQFVYRGFHYKCTNVGWVSFECHLTLVPASPPLILDICFASSPIIRHDTGQLQESGATAELQNFTDIPAQSVRSWYLR